MEEKQEKKKISKGGRIFAGIFAFIVLVIAINSGKNATTQQTSSTETQKIDVVQERINRINELYAEESSFDKVEVIGNNSIAIVFKELPDLGIEDEIDSITRGQAMNLSKEVNGVASVKTFVGGTASMFCTATKGQVNNCIDYR